MDRLIYISRLFLKSGVKLNVANFAKIDSYLHIIGVFIMFKHRSYTTLKMNDLHNTRTILYRYGNIILSSLETRTLYSYIIFRPTL